MIIQKGFRGKLQDFTDTNSEIEVCMKIDGHAVYDFCCFGVDSNNKLSDDRYMVFYNCTASPENEIRYTPAANSAKFNIMLGHLPQKINKLVFTVSIDGNSTMGQISSHTMSVIQNGTEAIGLSLAGSDFSKEKAIISMEIYKKDIWRIAFIANGFNGGIGELLKLYGGEEVKPSALPNQNGPAPVNKINLPSTDPDNRFIQHPVSPNNNIPQPISPNNTIPPLQPQQSPHRVELRKGQKVNLNKTGKSLGEVHINLNWSRPTGFLSSLFSSGVDLDLACLYELKDGRKGCVQALGRTFGSLDYAPYIHLDGDDRTGAYANGENLRINGNHLSEIRRILVYTFIYEGAANWKQANAVVKIKCPGSQEVIVHMDEYGSFQKLCAIAMIENVRDETFCIEKLIHFFRDQQEMDRCYGWGMNWRPGSK